MAGKSTREPRIAGERLQFDAKPGSPRERVLNTAVTLFAKNGFDATGVEEISVAAKLGRGALYYHMKSKEQVLYDISLSLQAHVRRRAEAVVKGPGDPLERIVRLVRTFVADGAVNREVGAVAVRDTASLSPQLYKEVIRGRRDYERIWQRAFDEAAEAGLLKPVNPLVTRGIITMFMNINRWIDESKKKPVDIADMYLDVLLDGLRA